MASGQFRSNYGRFVIFYEHGGLEWSIFVVAGRNVRIYRPLETFACKKRSNCSKKLGSEARKLFA